MSEADILKRPAGQVAPLLIRDLFFIATRRASSAEILYADRSRYSYATFADRVHRLAGALRGLGMRHGMTVGVMDWDTPRYLECFFAVPMMGAVLHTINVRLSAEQILYTINHAEDDVILVNGDFLPLLEKIWDRVEPGKTLVLLNDASAVPDTSLPITGEYEALLAAAPATFAFPDLDENTRATTFYTTGTTGLPKGVYFSHRQLVLHTLATRHGARWKWPGPLHRRRRLYAGHADVPRPRLGPALHRHRPRREAGLSGPLRARRAGRIDRA